MKAEHCHVWDMNLADVLHMLMVEGVKRVTLELDGKADEQGHVRLIIKPVAPEPLKI